MVEGGFKNFHFFTGVQCHLLWILLINASIIDGIAFSEDIFFCREGWEAKDNWNGCIPLPLSHQHPCGSSCDVHHRRHHNLHHKNNHFLSSDDTLLSPLAWALSSNSVHLTPTHIRVWWIWVSARVVRDALLLDLIFQICDVCGKLHVFFVFHIWRWRCRGFFFRCRRPCPWEGVSNQTCACRLQGRRGPSTPPTPPPSSSSECPSNEI